MIANNQYQLTMSQFCKEKILDHDPRSLKSNHQQIQSTILSQLLSSYMVISKNANLAKIHQQLTKILKNLKDSIDKILVNFNKIIDKANLQCQYDLSEDASAAVFNIVSAKRQAIQTVRCCDTFQIYSKILQSMGKNNTNKNTERVNNVVTKVTNQINQALKQFNNFAANYKPNEKPDTTVKKVQTNVVNRQPKVQQPEKTNRNGNQQARPQRGRANDFNKKNQSMMNPEIHLSGFTKISQLQKIDNGSERFNIKVKVLRMIKRFKMGELTKMQYLVGDQTGVAQCVSSVMSAIKPNMNFQITDCRIYLFKGTIKQIQTTKQSTIKVTSDIKDINHNLNLSNLHRKQQKRSQTMTRQTRVRPSINEDHRDRRRNQDNRQRQRSRSQQRSRKQGKQQVEGYMQEMDDRQLQYYDEEEQQLLQNIKDISVILGPDTQNYLKISQIQPGQQKINIMAQIYKIISQDDDDQDNNVKKEKRVSQDDDSILCILGDNTGIVKAMLPKTFAFIRQGNCIKLNKVNSEVIQEHIQIRLGKGSHLEQVKAVFPIIKFDNDISAQAWDAQDSDQNGQ